MHATLYYDLTSLTNCPLEALNVSSLATTVLKKVTSALTFKPTMSALLAMSSLMRISFQQKKYLLPSPRQWKVLVLLSPFPQVSFLPSLYLLLSYLQILTCLARISPLRLRLPPLPLFLFWTLILMVPLLPQLSLDLPLTPSLPPSSNPVIEPDLDDHPSLAVELAPHVPSEVLTSSSPPPQPPTRMLTRSQTNSLTPKAFPDYKLFSSTKYPLMALSSLTLPIEPRTYLQAAKHPCWLDAMQAEFTALLSNHTWTLVPRPLHQKVVRNKWVFKLKQKADGTIDRYKARLVAKGFDQEAGVDFHETFSPVIKPATIRLVLALVVHFNWVVHQLDISNAFLHGYLKEEVFMEQPKGFEDPTFPDHVRHLHKSIYGLKQAPRAWFMRPSQALLELGFSNSIVDTSLFLFHQHSIHIFVLIYVDDILVSSNSPAAVSGLISHLHRDFVVKDLGPLSYFLGIQATRQPQASMSLTCCTGLAWMAPSRSPHHAPRLGNCLALMGIPLVTLLSTVTLSEPYNIAHLCARILRIVSTNFANFCTRPPLSTWWQLSESYVI